MTEKSAADTSDLKKGLRREMLGIRDSLSPDIRERGKILITERILGHQWFYRCKRLIAFYPYGSEIDITDILSEALKQGKELYLPVTYPEGKEIQFYRVYDLKDLKEGFRGIREPSPDSDMYVYSDADSQAEPERDFMIIPGVAFDLMKGRLGYGGGYYDRYLSNKEMLRLHSVAVGFREQMIEEVPCSDKDMKPYQIICV